MARMKGADLITEHLIRNKIPYVFGICGHGNVGMLDSLYQAKDKIKLVSPRHEQVAAHMADALRPVVKRSFQPTRVDMLPLALRQATTTMLSGRPGPVNVDVPFNVFQEEDDVEMPPRAPALNAQRSGASPEQVAAALEMILQSKRPVFFVGHGVTLSEASAELTETAHKLGVPVIASPNGFGCLDMTDPLSLGFIGRNG